MPTRARTLSCRPQSFKLACLLGVALLTLTACGGGQSSGTETSSASHALGAPQQLYGEDQTGPFAGVTPLELTPGGSLGSLGLNLEPLFSEDLKNPNDRLARLEATVLAMQTDLQTLAPSMQRMAVVEKDLAAAVQELRDILNQQNGTAQAAPAAATPAPTLAPHRVVPPAKTATPTPAIKTEIPVAEKEAVVKTQADGVAGAILPDTGGISTPLATPAAAAPAAAPASPDTASGSASTIRALRLGEHGNKTRLVFDVTTKPVYRTDLDNNEKLLIVEIDNAAWSGKIPSALSSPMIQSYSTQALENNAGTRIIMVLKKSAKIGTQEVLNPESANGPYRLVLDLTNG